jgi:hypothetical protein
MAEARTEGRQLCLRQAEQIHQRVLIQSLGHGLPSGLVHTRA